MRTSLTHPLQIAEVQADPAQGRNGLTFCPGKHQPDAMTDGWRRDLDIDLNVIIAAGEDLLRRLHGDVRPQAEELAEAAHKLAGNAGTFGFLSLAAVARCFEAAVDGGSTDISTIRDKLCASLAAALAIAGHEHDRYRQDRSNNQDCSR
jgi:HPt (histidine-containing phosphotransfer) domain-containing protein